MNLTVKQLQNKAVTFLKAGKLDEAEASYRKIIKLKPDYAGANYNLGNILFKLGKLDEAEASYRKEIKLKYEFSAVYYNLGILLFKLERFDEAEINYKKATELKPDFLEAHYNLGNAQRSLKKFDDAEASYKKVIILKPDFADVHNNLGNIFFLLGKFEEAEASYKKAIQFEQNHMDAYNSLGVALHSLSKMEEAEVSYRKAIELNPNYIETYCNLGILLTELNRLDEAEIIANKAIEINPNYENALLVRGNALFKKKFFKLALKDFNACSSNKSKVLVLLSLYNLGRTKEVYEKIEKYLELDNLNIGVAAFSSFITHKEKKVTAHKFCNNPIDFIHFSNLSKHINNSNSFITSLIDELKNIKTRWQPSSKTTIKGFQSVVNLFENSPKKLEELKSIIMNELDSYYSKFKDDVCYFIQKWPTKKNLHGWHVILKQQGYQKPHIHVGGWLSGVIYLKVVPHQNRNEGAIELSLNGEQYFDVNSKKLIHVPKGGDIILFPSSLHHRTIPFTSDEDRISIAFDLMPM